MDVNGTIDRNAALSIVGDLIDPNLAERLLKPGEEASQAEVEDEQTVFVKLMAGIPVNVKPGQAYQLRLNTLKGLFQQNQMAQQLYQRDPQVKQAFEMRGKQLSLQGGSAAERDHGQGRPELRAENAGERKLISREAAKDAKVAKRYMLSEGKIIDREPKFKLGQRVYFVLGGMGIVTGILLRPHGVAYMVSDADGDERSRFDIELSA